MGWIALVGPEIEENLSAANGGTTSAQSGASATAGTVAGGRGGAGSSGASGEKGVAGRGPAGIGGPAGYGVVDPLPQPAQVCSLLAVDVVTANWQPGQGIAIAVQLSAGAGLGQVMLGAVMATAAVTASVTSAVRPYTAKLESAAWPSTTVVTLSFSCTGFGAGANYSATFSLDTSHPSNTGSLKVTMTRDMDAGM